MRLNVKRHARTTLFCSCTTIRSISSLDNSLRHFDFIHKVEMNALIPSQDNIMMHVLLLSVPQNLQFYFSECWDASIVRPAWGEIPLILAIWPGRIVYLQRSVLIGDSDLGWLSLFWIFDLVWNNFWVCLGPARYWARNSLLAESPVSGAGAHSYTYSESPLYRLQAQCLTMHTSMQRPLRSARRVRNASVNTTP